MNEGHNNKLNNKKKLNNFFITLRINQFNHPSKKKLKNTKKK